MLSAPSFSRRFARVLAALAPFFMFCGLAGSMLACNLAEARPTRPTGAAVVAPAPKAITSTSTPQQQAQGQCQPCKGTHVGSFVWVIDPTIDSHPAESLVQALDTSTCTASIVTVDPNVSMGLLTRIVPLGQADAPVVTPTPAYIVITQ